MITPKHKLRDLCVPTVVVSVETEYRVLRPAVKREERRKNYERDHKHFERS